MKHSDNNNKIMLKGKTEKVNWIYTDYQFDKRWLAGIKQLLLIGSKVGKIMQSGNYDAK